jgi:hypothetical protein
MRSGIAAAKSMRMGLWTTSEPVPRCGWFYHSDAILC